MYVIVLTNEGGRQTFKLAPSRAEADAFWKKLVTRTSEATQGKDSVCTLMMFQAENVENEGQARIALFDNAYEKIKGVTVRGIPTLLHKVSRSGPKAVTSVVVDQAEAEIKKQAQNYLTWLEGDLDTLDVILQRAKSGETAGDILRDLERIVYRIKGQGGMFGYVLVSSIATDMFNYLDLLDSEITPHDLEIFKVQADALRVVAARKLAGDGGEIGQVLMAELTAMVDKVLSKKADVLPRSARDLSA